MEFCEDLQKVFEARCQYSINIKDGYLPSVVLYMSSEWTLGDDFHMGEGHSCTPFLRIEDHPKKLNPNV